MAYEYPEEKRFIPASEEEARAKFAYFRKAEARINGGPGVVPPIYLVEPIRSRRRETICGTNSGYVKHMRTQTDPCRKCMDARAIYQRQYRAKKLAA